MAIDVHHEVTGPADAPVVVLSNSLGTTLEMWDRQRDALAGYRVVRYDTRGHGRSPVPDGPSTIADLGEDLIALLDRLEMERASLVGISLGGMTALWVAAHHPDRVARLAPCFTSARMGPPEMWRERIALVRAGGTGALADSTVDRWFTPAFRAREPGVVAEIHAMISAIPAEGYVSCSQAIAQMDLHSDLGRIVARTLVIAGAEDPSTPPAHGALIAEGIPGAELLVLADCAHLGNIGQTEAYNAALLGHLQGAE
jgi:3-oxoadipate enol-lactonase